MRHVAGLSSLQQVVLVARFVFYRPNADLDLPPAELGKRVGLHLSQTACLDAPLIEMTVKLLDKLGPAKLGIVFAAEKKAVEAQKRVKVTYFRCACLSLRLLQDRVCEYFEFFSSLLVFLKQLPKLRTEVRCSVHLIV